VTLLTRRKLKWTQLVKQQREDERHEPQGLPSIAKPTSLLLQRTPLLQMLQHRHWKRFNKQIVILYR